MRIEHVVLDALAQQVDHAHVRAALGQVVDQPVAQVIHLLQVQSFQRNHVREHFNRVEFSGNELVLHFRK